MVNGFISWYYSGKHLVCIAFGRLCEWDEMKRKYLYWNGQLVWTPALALYLCVGDRGLCPAGFIAHLRLYRHIRQAAIRDFFLFAVGSHAVIIYFG